MRDNCGRCYSGDDLSLPSGSIKIWVGAFQVGGEFWSYIISINRTFSDFCCKLWPTIQHLCSCIGVAYAFTTRPKSSTVQPTWIWLIPIVDASKGGSIKHVQVALANHEGKWKLSSIKQNLSSSSSHEKGYSLMSKLFQHDFRTRCIPYFRITAEMKNRVYSCKLCNGTGTIYTLCPRCTQQNSNGYVSDGSANSKIVGLLRAGDLFWMAEVRKSFPCSVYSGWCCVTACKWTVQGRMLHIRMKFHLRIKSSYWCCSPCERVICRCNK